MEDDFGGGNFLFRFPSVCITESGINVSLSEKPLGPRMELLMDAF